MPIAQGYTLPIRYEEIKPRLCKGNLPKYIQVYWKNRRKCSAVYVSYLNTKGKWVQKELTKNKQKIKLDLCKITKKKDIGKTVIKVAYNFKINGTLISRNIRLAFWKDCELKDVSIGKDK